MDGIRIAHTRHDEHDVYGGRGGANGRRHIANTLPGNRGWLGNPFTTDLFERDVAIQLYAYTFAHRLYDDDFWSAVTDLQGQTVACWCRQVDEDTPACHLDVVDQFIKHGYEGVITTYLSDGLTLQPDDLYE